MLVVGLHTRWAPYALGTQTKASRTGRVQLDQFQLLADVAMLFRASQLTRCCGPLARHFAQNFKSVVRDGLRSLADVSMVPPEKNK